MSATESNGSGFFTDVRAWTPRHWVGVGLSLVVAGVNLFVGATAGETPLFIVGGSFLFGVALFCTRFWRPVLYLLGVVHVGGLGVLWVLAGVPYLLWGVVSGICSLALAAVALSLFVEAERSAS